MHNPVNLGAIIDPHRDPDKIAVIDVMGDADTHARHYTYREVDALANAVARTLSARQYAPGTRIALLAVNSVPYVATVLGIMRAGLTAVPVNHKFPPPLIAYVLADSGAALVFHDERRHDALPASVEAVALPCAPVTTIGASCANASSPALRPKPADAQPDRPTETSTDRPTDAPALMLYTSGSTGKPKGVLLSHASHLWVAQTRRLATPLDDERALIAAPLYHMNALALMFLALASHATTVLLPQFNASQYIRAIAQYRCTWLTAVPPMIAMMLQERDLIAQTDLSSVRVIRMGSAPVSSSLLDAIHHLVPNARVINAYGTTEGGPVVFGAHPAGTPTPRMSVGYPHAAVSLRLERGADDPDEQGVLALKSPAIMLGYHQRPDVTHPVSEDGYYTTGDVFRRDTDGFYYFVGRRDDMFVSGGENIYPGEVEKMLEQHPAVEQAAVVPIDDDIKGQKPVAFVVRRAGMAIDAAALKAYALAHAPAYQHPRHVWFVDRFPLASTNKTDRGALKAEAKVRLSVALS
ncbi:MAG: class I adenylate-forming enzyme family protein [Burkholderiaceae bacterium]